MSDDIGEQFVVSVKGEKKGGAENLKKALHVGYAVLNEQEPKKEVVVTEGGEVAAKILVSGTLLLKHKFVSELLP